MRLNCDSYEKIKSLRKNKINVKKSFETNLEKLLGAETLFYLEPKNHYESAVQYYYKMIQLHSDGRSYKDKLHEVYMLEDDYNDNTAHYTIAAERIRINTGDIKEKIKVLNGKIEDSKLYKYKSYLVSSNKPSPPPSKNVIDEYLRFLTIPL